MKMRRNYRSSALVLALGLIAIVAPARAQVTKLAVVGPANDPLDPSPFGVNFLKWEFLYVVIHVDTEEYTVATAFTAANRAMMARRPIDVRLFGRKIGPEPDNDRVAQIAAMEVLAERRK